MRVAESGQTMKILVTTDGSGRSWVVIPHAARLAAAIDGELVLARVLDPRLDCDNAVTLSLNDAVRIVSERWSHELTARLAEAKVGGRVVVCVRGQPTVGVRGQHEEIRDSILRVAKEERADILSMSSGGSSVVRHALLGSVAMGVLGRTPLPMLVAGERVEGVGSGEYHIIVTSDGSPDAARALEATIPLCVHPSVRVTLLRVLAATPEDPGNAADAVAVADELEQLRQRFPVPANVRTMVRTIDPLGGVDTAIVNAASMLGASAIAISTHGHSAKYHVFMGSVALGVLRQSPVPLLLVRSGPAPVT